MENKDFHEIFFFSQSVLIMKLLEMDHQKKKKISLGVFFRCFLIHVERSINVLFFVFKFQLYLAFLGSS